MGKNQLVNEQNGENKYLPYSFEKKTYSAKKTLQLKDIGSLFVLLLEIYN